MQEYSAVRLIVMGPLKLSRKFKNIKSRIIRKEFCPHLEHMRYYSQVDINLAPLESTVFNQCKSELKIFEAGAMGVPTIASAVDSYANYIENGIDGVLATGELEWYECLRKLITDEEIRQNIGRKAKDKALWNHHYLRNTKLAAKAYQLEVKE